MNYQKLFQHQSLPLYAILFGVLVSVLLIVLSIKAVLIEEEEQFLLEAEHVLSISLYRLNSANELMHSLSTFYNASTNVDSDDFRIFANTFLNRHEFLTSLFYMPKIHHQQRYDFIKKTRDIGYFTYNINTWEENLFTKTKDNKHYFPILYNEPHTPGLIKHMGLDVYSIPILKDAADKAIELADTVATLPVEVLYGTNHYVLFRPLYIGKDNIPDNAESRALLVSGLLGASINIERLVKDISNSDHLDISLNLSSPNQGTANINLAHVHEHKNISDKGWVLKWFSTTQKINLGSYQYNLTTRKPIHFHDAEKAFVVYALFIGISITVLLYYFAHSITSKSAFLERQHEEIKTIVEERTKELHHIAHHDALTELPNRVMFMDRLEHSIVRAQRQNKKVAILFLDLDRFKVINDSLGHHVGDELLCEVARRLLLCTRETDTVARLSGDEFVVILEDMNSTDYVTIITRNIIDSLAKSINIQKNELFITTSIGIALYPYDATDTDTLLRYADTAMYKAKESGRNDYKYYSDKMGDKAANRLSMEMHLRNALERNEFIIYYQPKIEVSTGKLSGAEALIRWNHPERGMVSPLDFIPLLEETGLIIPVSDWVLKEACTKAKQWQQLGHDNFQIAVNLSVTQLSDMDFVYKLQSLLKELHFDAHYLELELTESMLMENIDSSIQVLNSVSQLGVSIAIDDFGTGYSSLHYLKALPLNTLKIDRTFIMDITENQGDLTIVSTIIAMAQSMKLEVVAEGIETIEQGKILKNLRCDYLQGYLISKPLHADLFYSTQIRNVKNLS